MDLSSLLPPIHKRTGEMISLLCKEVNAKKKANDTTWLYLARTASNIWGTTLRLRIVVTSLRPFGHKIIFTITNGLFICI